MTDLDLEPPASSEGIANAAPVSSSKTVRTPEELKSLLKKRYPKLEKESIGEVVTLLPGGQLIKLWRTLHQNLHVTCVQEIVAGTDKKQQRKFLSVLTEHLCELLENVRVSDASIPIATMENVKDMMIKLRDECLAPLGTEILKRKQDDQIMNEFLKLAYAWSELHGLLLHYNNEKYKEVKPALSTNPSYFNLSYLHPYLTSKNWIKFGSLVESSNDSASIMLLNSLVEQKLKYMTTFEKSDRLDENHKMLLQHHVQECSNYLLSIPQISSSDQFSNDIYGLISTHISEADIITLAAKLVTQYIVPTQDRKPLKVPSIPEDPKLHYAIVLETIIEVLRSISKIKLTKKHFNNVINDILSPENRSILILQSSESGKVLDDAGLDQRNEVLKSLLNATNGFIENLSSQSEADFPEFSTDTILSTLVFLSKLPLEDYSKTLKTIVFHCGIAVLLALVKCDEQSVLDTVTSILTQCTMNVKGNEFVFLINWPKFFNWFCQHVDCFSLKAQRQCIMLVVQNIYLSSKVVLEFENCLELFDKKCKINSSFAPTALFLLEFLVQILEEFVKSKSKSKLITQVQNHIRKLTQFVVKSLKSNSNSKNILSDSPRTNVNIFHGCWLVLHAIQVLDLAKAPEEMEDVIKPSNVAVVVTPYIDTALNLLETKEEVPDMMDVDQEENNTPNISELKLSKSYALAFLRSVYQSKENVPTQFTTKLWNIWMKFGCATSSNLPTDGFGEIPMILPKDIYEAASTEEFEAISGLLEAELLAQSSMEKPDEMKMESLARLLDEILEVQLTPEKKTARRRVIENALVSSLGTSLQWTASDACIHRMVIPFLQFEVKLLRRRNAMCSTNSLSLCLTSITSVPLNEVSDIKTYRTVFCIVGDLLNAFTVHRLDVLSFRMPVFLQCFQYVVESLTKRADQGNRLTDDEILDLKYCAHSIERICQSAKLGQKEFSRVSPYFIAILMRQFELFTVYPAVKDSLLNGCYKLLDLCDAHGISQLNSMFTVGSREIFKTVHELYRKFYRYSGKV